MRACKNPRREGTEWVERIPFLRSSWSRFKAAIFPSSLPLCYFTVTDNPFGASCRPILLHPLMWFCNLYWALHPGCGLRVFQKLFPSWAPMKGVNATGNFPPLHSSPSIISCPFLGGSAILSQLSGSPFIIQRNRKYMNDPSVIGLEESQQK